MTTSRTPLSTTAVSVVVSSSLSHPRISMTVSHYCTGSHVHAISKTIDGTYTIADFQPK